MAENDEIDHHSLFQSMTITQASMLENIELLQENSHAITKWPSIDVSLFWQTIVEPAIFYS